MSSNKRQFTHKSSTKTTKIQCRVETCKQWIIEQGYTRHLRTVHPDEDFKDLRGYGVKKFSWGRQSGRVVAGLPLQVDNLPDVGDQVVDHQGSRDWDSDEDMNERNDTERTRFRERSWDRESSEEEGTQLDGRQEREKQMR